MPTRKPKNPVDFIEPLNINGMQGRVLHVPAPKNKQRETLLIYGHHALLERWWGLVENLNTYGSVTVPDLPGFGGMESFYSIGKDATIDNFADYLAAFIKLRFKRRRITIVGISFGFAVTTRMLQRYPELTNQVDLLVSMVGFMHHDDFWMSSRTRKFFRLTTRFFATRPVAKFIRYCCLNSFVIKNLYTHLPSSKRRFVEVEPEEFEMMTDFEVTLWQANDVRTHWITTFEFLNLDNCQQKVDLPIWHIASQGDHWFNNQIVKQHMLVVFNDYHFAEAQTKAHTPSVLADKKGLAVLVPTELRRALNKQP